MKRDRFGDTRHKVEAPVKTHTPGHPIHDYIETHPAYAMINANRCTGSVNLHGSDFEHHSFVSVTIAKSERSRGLSNDHSFAREELIEVWLSEAQWAHFVSAMNAGQGTPCTLKHVDRVDVSGLPPAQPKTDTFTAEMLDTMKDSLKQMEKVRERLVSRKVDKDTLREIDGAIQQIRANIPFVAEQFGEHVENTIEDMKIEVNAYVLNAVTRAGLKALGAPVIALPEHEQ